jgi:exopolysaccharide production protein ExoZ
MSEAGRSHTVVPIQILRAVAALGVLVSHISLVLGNLGGLPTALPSFKFGEAGVDLFFVISGFVMVYASEPLFARADGPLTFVVHRLIRIVPLYWALTTVYLILSHVVPESPAGYTAGFVAASYAFIPAARPSGLMQPVMAQGWTLNYEMLFYAIFAVAVLAPRRVAVLAATLALIALIVAGRLLDPPPPILAFWGDPLVLEFVFGMAIALGYREGWKLPQPLALALIAAGILAVLTGLRIPGADHRLVDWGIPAALIVAGASLGRFSASQAVWRPLIVLGDASYALYLVHAAPIRLIIVAARHAGIDLGRTPWLYFAASFVAALALAIAVHCLFERPVTTALRRLAAFAPLRSSGARSPWPTARVQDSSSLAIVPAKDKLVS